MRTTAAIAFSLILLSVFLAGCTASGQKQAGDNPVPTGMVINTITPYHASPTEGPLASIPLNFSGKGNTTTDVFPLAGRKITTITLKHEGTSGFTVRLASADGSNPDKVIIDTYGPYNGTFRNPINSGRYTLNVTADGPWEVDIPVS